MCQTKLYKFYYSKWNIIQSEKIKHPSNIAENDYILTATLQKKAISSIQQKVPMRAHLGP